MKNPTKQRQKTHRYSLRVIFKDQNKRTFRSTEYKQTEHAFKTSFNKLVQLAKRWQSQNKLASAYIEDHNTKNIVQWF